MRRHLPSRLASHRATPAVAQRGGGCGGGVCVCVCFGRVGCPRSNVGSRLFLMADDSKYQVFKLKNRSHLTPAAPPRRPDSVSIRARLPTLHMHQLVPCLCAPCLVHPGAPQWPQWPHDTQLTTASPIFPTAARRLPRPFRPRPSSSRASEHIGRGRPSDRCPISAFWTTGSSPSMSTSRPSRAG